MLSTFYRPTNQKNLFNQSCIINIKKWLKQLNGTSENTTYKKILFIYGPDGCGKSATLDLLLKTYNVYSIDQDQIKVNDVMSDFINTLPDYNASSIQSITQKSNVTGNIILIDDCKSNEKTISNFIENLYETVKKNIPLIICCSDYSLRQKFKSIYDIVFVDFKHASNLELNILIKKIFNDKKKEITNDNINHIIETSQYNLHQVYYISDHILATQDAHQQLNLENLKKDIDIDLNERIRKLFDLNKEYDFLRIYELMDVDTYVVNANIFQNYLNFYDIFQTDLFQTKKQIEQIDIIKLDYMALSCDSFISTIYDNVYDFDTNYNIMNGMKPLYYMHEFKEKFKALQNETEYTDSINKKLSNSLEHYSGHTHNYIINLNELNQFIAESFNNLNTENNKICMLDKHNLWDFMYIINNNLILIHKCLNIKKRNVKYETYIDLLKTNDIYNKYTFIIDTIWNYALFETNPNVLKIKYKKEDININLRIFKRLVNIFTIGETNSMKTNIENIIKEDLINRIIELQNKNNLISDNNVNNMMYDLSDIWLSLKST
jgi:ABC-type dipeptide/oligopeptide/nickel transport system ATPase component